MDTLSTEQIEWASLSPEEKKTTFLKAEEPT